MESNDRLWERKHMVETIIDLCNDSLEMHPLLGSLYDKGYFKDRYARTLEEKMSWMALLDLKDRLETRNRLPDTVDGMLRDIIKKECGKEALKYLGMTKTEEYSFKWYKASGLSGKMARKYLKSSHLAERAALNEQAIELVREAARYEKMAGLIPVVPKYHPNKIRNMFRNKDVEDPFPYPYITENDVKEMEERLDTMMKNGNTANLTSRVHDMLAERNAVRDHLSFYVVSAERLGYEDPMECMQDQFGKKLTEDTLLRGLVIGEKIGLEEHPDLHMLVFCVQQALDEEFNRRAIDKALTTGQLTPEETQGLDSIDSKHIGAVMRATSGQPREAVIQALRDRNDLLKLCRDLDTTNISDVQIGKDGEKVTRTEDVVFNQPGTIYEKFGPVSDRMMADIMKEASASRNLGAAARMSTNTSLLQSGMFAEAIRGALIKNLTENFATLPEKDRKQLIDAANRTAGMGETANPFLTSVALAVLKNSGNENLIRAQQAPFDSPRNNNSPGRPITQESIQRAYAQILGGRTL